MKRPIFLIFTNAMILIVIFCLLAQSLIVVSRLAVTTEAKGTVEVQRGGRGAWQPLVQKLAVKVGDNVRTGKNSQVEFVYADGTRFKLMPESQLTVSRASYNSALKSEDSDLHLTQGKVFVRIMKSLTPSSSFQVDTPTAVAAVRGTIFSVEAKEGRTQVAVWKGHVDVSSTNGKEQTQITPGRCVDVAPNVVKTEADTALAAQFAQETSIVKPYLDFDAHFNGNGGILVRGSTEAGDTLMINGTRQKVFGNGGFLKVIPVKAGESSVTVTTQDKHGAMSSLTKTATQ